MSESDCPDRRTLSGYVTGKLPETKADILALHLERCEECQRQLDELADEGEVAAVADGVARALARRPAADDEDASPELSRMIVAAQKLPEEPDAEKAEKGTPLGRGGGRADSSLRQEGDEDVSLDAFVKCLRKSRLLHSSDVDLLTESTEASDTQSFARELVHLRKLTPFQAGALKRGRWKGLVMGKYVLLEKLGRGGMGHVFKARHRRLGKIVCLKILPTRDHTSPDLVERFRREARAVAALDHPNIVVAHDADDADAFYFLVMEYIEGRDLARRVADEGPFPVDQAIELVQQVARALHYAHGRGIIHRDIKPHNLLLDPTGLVKVLDLGLARFDSYLDDSPDGLSHVSMTTTNVVMGTVDYMSPEQALNSRNAKAPADIYSLGCTLWFLLTGEAVFDGRTVVERLVAHREQPIPSLRAVRPEVSRELDAVFRKMVAKSPVARYASMEEVAADLEAVREGRKPEVLVAAAAQGGPGSSVRMRIAVALVLICAGIAIGHVKTNGLPGMLQSRESGPETAGASAEPQPSPPSKTPSVAATTPETTPETTRGRELLPENPSARTLRAGGAGRVLVVISHKDFSSSDFAAISDALRKRGVEMVTASYSAGQATPRGKKGVEFPPTRVEMLLDDVVPSDFDGVVFCGGVVTELLQNGRAEGSVRELVGQSLSSGGFIACLEEGADVVKSTGAFRDCETRRQGELRLCARKGQPGFILIAPSHKLAESMMALTFDKLRKRLHGS